MSPLDLEHQMAEANKKFKNRVATVGLILAFLFAVLFFAGIFD
jgi:hypothetical protein